MASIPRDPAVDNTLSLLREGYEFIPNRCARNETDVFATRLMLRPAICASGADAARMFYQPDRFSRGGALPPTALRLLQDLGSVQAKDGEAHRHRKRMFLSAMTPPRIQALVTEAENEWKQRVGGWEQAGEVVLHEEAQAIFCRAACRWGNIPLDEADANARTEEFAAMIDGAGAVGPRVMRGLVLRRRTERWARELVEQVRSGDLDPANDAPLAAVAWHREADGELLEPKVAAVELINFLRPTVAVARYVMFCGLALHEHPEAADALREDLDGYAEAFVHEVRRFYPFFPAIAGRARREFEWRGHRFKAGDWVLLDIYGTNRDARIWHDPDEFRPERFRSWKDDAFSFIPQGGGDHSQGHRCPGERTTIELMKMAARLLATEVSYEVPNQDLSIDLSRMPAQPASQFVMAKIRRR